MDSTFQALPCIILSLLGVSHCVLQAASCSQELGSQWKTIMPHNNFTNTVNQDLAKWGAM